MASPSESARARVRAVRDAYSGPQTIGTENGDVTIENLRIVDDGPRSRVEVTVTNASGGDPDFVIVNPPTLVPDPTGDVIVRGQRFREDPLAAVAFVIASNGGADAKARDTRRGRR